LRALCRLYPADFRDLLGEDVALRFRVERERIAGERGGARAQLWALRTLAGFAVGAVSERLRARAHRETSTKRRWMVLDTWTQDARIAARSLLVRSPAFTALAVLTLALGVAADTTVFSVAESVLLRPLPYPDSDELVAVAELSEGGSEESVTGPNFLDWKASSRAFEHLVARSNPAYGPPSTVLGGTEPVRVPWSSVSQGFFQMMGASPAVGRFFADDDYAPQASLVAVVSHAFWERYMGGTQDLASRPLQGEGSTFTVVGVAPRGFDFPDHAQIWLPLAIEPGGSRTAHNWLVTGRLRDGVRVEDAQADLDAITGRLRAVLGEEMTAVATRVRPLREDLYGSMETPLGLLLAASAFVLLVGCINLASALLARGRQREGEIAVRSALGASRGRLVRQLLTESGLLALLGTTAGVALALPAVRLVVSAGPPALRDRVDVHGGVLLLTSAVSIGAILLFGLLPAVVGARSDLASMLRAAGRGGTRRRGAHWNLLVAGEVALTMTLLAGAGVLTRSFGEVVAVDPGFDAKGVLTVDLPFPTGAYTEDASMARSQDAIVDAVLQLPGVAEAGLINHLPLGGLAYNGSFEREDGVEVDGSVDYRIASAGYFSAMRIPVLEGRAFASSDDARTEDVAVITRSMAERFWPGESALGRRIRNLANDSWIYQDRWITIVGVVGDVRHRALTAPARPTVYVHNQQRPARATSPVLVIRPQARGVLSAADVRARIQQVEPRLPVEVQSMDARLAGSVVDRRFMVLVMGAFALATLLLAGVGIYGVVSYAVAQRTREMGVRIALGAGTGRVLRGVVASSLRSVVVGAALGVGGALVMGRFLSGLLFGVGAADPLSLAAASALLLSVATLAAVIPARRATRVDPVSTMRTE
jgi:putative ABC transport system permease protein